MAPQRALPDAVKQLVDTHSDKARDLQMVELRPMPTGARIHNTFLEFPNCGGLDSEDEDRLTMHMFRRQQTDSALVSACSSRVMLEQDHQGVHRGQADKPEPEPVPTEETLQPEDNASDNQEGDCPFADSTSVCPNRQVDERVLAARNLAACGGGLNGLLTVMVRHIPSRYTQHKFMREINARGFLGKYDLFYLLMQPKSRLNRGFAFINFNTAQDAEEFYRAFHDQRLRHFHIERPLSVMPADLQGFEANVEHYLLMMRATRNRRALQTGRALFFRQLPEHLANLAGRVDTAELEPFSPKHRSTLPVTPVAPMKPGDMLPRFCVNCGEKKQPDHKFCTHCGARAPTML